MRILIVKLSSLGDLFHALPAVARIKDVWGAEIHWVTHAGYADLVARFEPVDRVIAFPRRRFFSQARSFVQELRRDDYDAVFDMQGLLKSAWVARLARTKRRVGPSFHREGSRWFYDEVAGPRNKQRHAVVENLDLLAHLGIPQGDVAFPVRWPVPPGLPAGPRVGVIPCSRWATKNWPPGHFVEVARALAGEARLFVFGAPEDRGVCRQIAAAAGDRATDLCAQTTLPELGGWLQAMDLVITVDSGPMHVAAAAGAPVLAIFGATDPRRTGPYGARHRVLARDDLPCRPCLSRTCRLPERDTRCLAGLSPEAVLAEARALLRKT
ncbi:MAG TPA: glycosyltransferase family 9 protein [Kiritimatiellia bacterium]|nr:glycosyltransferase family 9 protein [Kiritimatiellia bacterium]HMO98942.1 glycosyltransferase family 9 protein [Kiritimatiellia bacterium]HMP95725.1 glycosyltransferase family 9 protein [Kiritimatiellia bacterium]